MEQSFPPFKIKKIFFPFPLPAMHSCFAEKRKHGVEWEVLEPLLSENVNIEPIKISRVRTLFFYRNTMYVVGLSLLLLLFFTLKIYGKRPKNGLDFIMAKHCFMQWEQSSGRQGKPLKELLCLLEKHPELQAEYQAKIAQSLIAWQEGKQAKDLGAQALKRTSQSYFKKYAECSLLLADKQLDTALELSLSLKEQMLKDSAFLGKGWEIKGCGAGLFAFNLMRIAILYQEMGMNKLELDTWEEIKEYAISKSLGKKSKVASEGFESLVRHFTVGTISLLDYISWREKQLTQS